MQKLSEPTKVAVIGGGSWATALVKILSENNVKIAWWLKNVDDARHIKEFGKNPRYLSNIQINPRKVKPTTDLKKSLEGAQVVILAVPAAFIEDVLASLKKEDLKDKVIVSAIKGMVPSTNELVTDFVEKKVRCSFSKPLCYCRTVSLRRNSHGKAFLSDHWGQRS